MARQGSRGCWTCRDRRVRCDRALPHCGPCTKSKRQCQGYGMRLSWPRDHDHKRFIVGPAVTRRTNRTKVAGVSDGEDGISDSHSAGTYWFVHTVPADVEVYQDMLAARRNLQGWQAFAKLQWPTGPENPLLWTALQLGEAGKSLMQYFYSIAYTSIASFSAYSTSIRGLLIRMAFSSNSLPAQAIRHSMLAIASAHRKDQPVKIAKYKLAALQALARSVNKIIDDPAEAARHVAAVMILTSLHMQGCGAEDNEWLSYLAGARQIIKKSRYACDMICSSDDISELVDWVYHQDVFSRFTEFHWRRAEGHPLRRTNQVPVYQRFDHPLRRPRPGRDLLGLFHDVFDVMLEPNPENSLTREEEMQRLVQLRQGVERLRYTDQIPHHHPNILEVKGVELDAFKQEETDMPAVFELYRLSALVCLTKTGECRFGWPGKVDDILDQATEVMSRMETCQRQFPLMILGCSARTEEHRRVAIDLFMRSTESLVGWPMWCLKRSIEFAWVQCDLHADQDLLLDFGKLVRTLCGNCISVPNLA